MDKLVISPEQWAFTAIQPLWIILNNPQMDNKGLLIGVINWSAVPFPTCPHFPFHHFSHHSTARAMWAPWHGGADARVGEQDEKRSTLPQRCWLFLRQLQGIQRFPNLPLIGKQNTLTSCRIEVCKPQIAVGWRCLKDSNGSNSFTLS